MKKRIFLVILSVWLLIGHAWATGMPTAPAGLGNVTNADLNATD